MSQKALISGSGFGSTGKIQWGPTLTAHDPNPPITLETAASGASIVPLVWGTLAGRSILLGRLVA